MISLGKESRAGARAGGVGDAAMGFVCEDREGGELSRGLPPSRYAFQGVEAR